MVLVRHPIYQQLHDLLLESIRADYRPGSRFLTEREVGVRFGVSRATANKALAALVAEGKLEFRKGVGTFVPNPPLAYDLRSLVSFTEKAAACDAVPSTRVRRCERRESGPAGSPLEGRLCWFVDRVRLADHVPVIWEQRWVDATLCPDLSTGPCSGSLYAYWSEQLGLAIGGAEQRLKVVVLSPEVAELLETPAGCPAFVVHAVGRLVDGRALWVEETVYRGDCYEFIATLGPIASTGRLSGRLLRASDSSPVPGSPSAEAP